MDPVLAMAGASPAVCGHSHSQTSQTTPRAARALGAARAPRAHHRPARGFAADRGLLEHVHIVRRERPGLLIAQDSILSTAAPSTSRRRVTPTRASPGLSWVLQQLRAALVALGDASVRRSLQRALALSQTPLPHSTLDC